MCKYIFKPSHLRANLACRQENLLAGVIRRFGNPRWTELRVNIAFIVNDRIGSWALAMLPGLSLEQYVRQTLDYMFHQVGVDDGFSQESGISIAISPTLELQLTVCGRSPLLDGLVPFIRIKHAPTTHRHEVMEPHRWKEHFEYTMLAPDASTLVPVVNRCLLWEVDSQSGSDFTPDSEDSTSDSDYGSDSVSDSAGPSAASS